MRSVSRLAFVVALVFVPSARAEIVATSVDDICAPSDNPCVIDEVVQLADGHTFDFGERTLRIEGDGVLHFGAAVSHVRCGRLEVDVPEGAVAIRASATYEDGPAWVPRRLEVVRQCSDRPRDCAAEADCDLGECRVRVCSLDPAVQCFEGGGGCDFGICEDDHECTSGYPPRPCGSNADCNVGPCGSQLYCQGSQDYVLPFHLNNGLAACSSNGDCSYGDCSVGDGTADLGGSMHLEIPFPYNFVLFAAGDLTIRGPVEVEGRDGDLNLVSGVGDVVAKAPLRTSGAYGTSIYLRTEARDVIVDAPIEADGEKEGGSVGLHAGRSVYVHADVTARTTGRRAGGGRISLLSGEDIRIEGGTGSDPIELHAGFTTGHEAGKADERGGVLSLWATRDASFDAFSRLRTDGHDTLLTVNAFRDLLFDGDLEAQTFGAGRTGAVVSLSAARDLRLGASAGLEVSGEEGALAGALALSGERDVEVNAQLRFEGARREQPYGYSSPWIDISGCMVRIGSDADFLNTAADSRNRIEARGGLAIDEGASVVCENGSNIARVRSQDNLLSVEGTIDPPLVVGVAAHLAACENCIHPQTGERELCDDGFDCTKDVCTNGVCGALPDDSVCDDGLYCNGSEVCSTALGCSSGIEVDCSFLDENCRVGVCDETDHSCVQLLADEAACDDGDECTLADTCRGEVCKGIRDVGCEDCGSQSIEWGEDCDDGDETFAFGDACRGDCQWAGCGHPTGSTSAHPMTSDALYVLRTAVALADCHLTVCDADDSGAIETVDALLVLRASVGLLGLACPAPA